MPLRPRAAEMIEHQGDRRGLELRAERLADWKRRVELDVQPVSLGAIRRRLKSLQRHGRIADAGGREVQPNAADAGFLHRIQRRIGGVRVDHGDAAGPRTQLRDGVQHAAVFRTVHACLPEHPPIHVEGRCQRAQFRREFRLDEAAPTPDQKFLADLTATVQAHLSDTNLGVEDVATYLGLTRMQLYRKVKAVLGTGVTEFIQGQRLDKAGELLLDESRSITDVAYELGFSTPSYFSSSFRARYQLSPSEYRARHVAH